MKKETLEHIIYLRLRGRCPSMGSVGFRYIPKSVDIELQKSAAILCRNKPRKAGVVWTIDHIVPLSSWDGSARHLVRLNNIKNLQWLSRQMNSIKHAGTMEQLVARLGILEAVKIREKMAAREIEQLRGLDIWKIYKKAHREGRSAEQMFRKKDAL